LSVSQHKIGLMCVSIFSSELSLKQARRLKSWMTADSENIRHPLQRVQSTSYAILRNTSPKKIQEKNLHTGSDVDFRRLLETTLPLEPLPRVSGCVNTIPVFEITVR
jgi:hypothetical protein